MKKRMFALLLASLFIATAASGCAASAPKNQAYDTGDAYYGYSGDSTAAAETTDSEYNGTEYDEAAGNTASSLGLETQTQPGRLVILNADVNLETTDFDGSVKRLQTAIDELGGYVSGSSTDIYNSTYSLRNASYTVRIPAEKFNDFIAKQDSIGNVNYCNVWSDDVTSSYRDIETRLETLRTKYDRLLAMLESADVMADIIEIENAISDTTYQIESLEGSLKSYDDRIAYSTVTVNITQVRVITESSELPKTLGERISQQFKTALENTGVFFEDLIVFLVGALPVIVILAVIAAVIVIITRATRTKRLIRREERRVRNEKSLADWRAKHGSYSDPAKTGSASENSTDSKENKE